MIHKYLKILKKCFKKLKNLPEDWDMFLLDGGQQVKRIKNYPVILFILKVSFLCMLTL